MASSKLYKNKKEEIIHARIIQYISMRYGVAEDRVKALYEKELLELKQGARVEDFLSVLAARRVRLTLRHALHRPV